MYQKFKEVYERYKTRLQLISASRFGGNMKTLQLSQHAVERSQKRRISEQEIDLVMEYGYQIYQGGALFIFLRAKDLPIHIRHKFPKNLEGTTIVMDPQSNTILTLYRNKNALRDIKRKTKYFQDKNILLAHGGGHKVLEYMLYTKDLKNVFYDFSLTSNYLKHTSVKQDIVNFIKFNNSKIFFGSDYPDFNVSDSLESYKKLIEISEIEDEKIKKIFSDNIKKFLEVGKL